MPPFAARLGRVGGWLLLGVALFDWWCRVPLDGARLLNADLVALPALVEDVLYRGHPFAHAWHLTPAPGFFPDGVLYLLGRALSGSVEWGQALAPGAQVLWLAFALDALFVRLRGRGVAGLGPGLAALVLALGASGRVPFVFVAMPAYHTGVAVLAVTATALWCAEAARPRRWQLGLLGVLLVAGVASDSLLLAGPGLAVGVALLATWRHWRTPGWRVGAVMVAACLSGFGLGRLVPFPDHAQHRLHLAALPSTVALAWHQALAFNPVEQVVGLAGWGALLVGALWRRRPWVERVVAGVWALSVGLTIAAVLATGNLNDAGWERYLLWPMVAGLVGVWWLSWRRWGGLAVAAVGVAVSVAPGAWRLAAPTTYALRADLACVDQVAEREDARLLVGDYWHAKPVTLLSTKGVRVAQFNPDLQSLSLWITSRAWFWPSREAGLVLTDGLEPAGLARFGDDYEVVTCGSLHLRVYRGAARAAVQAYLQQQAVGAMGAPP
jgi:hypothetical protein